ncbi:ADP-ribosylglycohydrolase family protein [Kitasatospora sp. NPDC048286]|uniref:ADP-ribosylglycohydrolase family protein n=1 Tax=unclassified Kitasatospora TaxID=2633591 RepID=UPI003721AFA9
MTIPSTHAGPALDALLGLAVGDALGAQFFVPETARAHLADRTEPPGPWPWTDDTEMACSVHAAHTERGAIDTFDLTHAFALRHDFDRGYGPAANRLLRLIREGGDAERLAAALFDGQGSYGNGAAMRVAPLGAAYAEDPKAVVGPAARTALITHTHPQAVDGAIAVAVAAAYAARTRTRPMTPDRFLEAVAALTPNGAVKDGLREARGLLAGADFRLAARMLGNGSRTSAADTVPYALWCAARNPADYRAAVRDAIAAGGDMDTVAAITGGVVAAHTGTAGIPRGWLDACEPLPDWAFPEPGSVRAAGEPHLTPISLPRPHPVPDLLWSDADWERIRRGLRARDADERWVAFTSEGVLHLHRSVGGAEIYRVRVARVRGGWRPTEVLVEADPGRHRGWDDHTVLPVVLGLARSGYGLPGLRP